MSVTIIRYNKIFLAYKMNFYYTKFRNGMILIIGSTSNTRDNRTRNYQLLHDS